MLSTVSAQLAKSQVEHEFEKFQVADDLVFESDFDRMVKRLPTKLPGHANLGGDHTGDKASGKTP